MNKQQMCITLHKFSPHLVSPNGGFAVSIKKKSAIKSLYFLLPSSVISLASPISTGTSPFWNL